MHQGGGLHGLAGWLLGQLLLGEMVGTVGITDLLTLPANWGPCA